MVYNILDFWLNSNLETFRKHYSNDFNLLLLYLLPLLYHQYLLPALKDYSHIYLFKTLLLHYSCYISQLIVLIEGVTSEILNYYLIIIILFFILKETIKKCIKNCKKLDYNLCWINLTLSFFSHWYVINYPFPLA